MLKDVLPSCMLVLSVCLFLFIVSYFFNLILFFLLGYFHKNSTNPVDFTKDIKVELSGLSASEVKAKLKEIVLLGDMKYLKRDEDDIIVGLDRLNPPSY